MDLHFFDIYKISEFMRTLKVKSKIKGMLKNTMMTRRIF
jgi:hypothetical protein